MSAPKPKPASSSPAPTSAPTPAPSLPPLTPRQSALLSAFITSRGDLAAVLASADITAPELLEWSQHPAVQAHLLALKSLAHTALDYRAAQTRTAALNKLESLLTSSSDPIEQRRAANSIAAVASERRGTSPRSTQHSALGTSRPRTQDSGPRTLPLTRDFPPTYTPAPSLSHEHLAHLVASAIQTPQDDTSVAALRAFLHPDATLFGRLLPDPERSPKHTAQVLSFLDPVLTCTVRPISRFPDDSSFCYRLTIVNARAETHPLDLTLTKDPSPAPNSPHPHCWLITDLGFPQNSS